VKNIFFSGLASTSLLLVSCSAGDNRTDSSNETEAAVIDPAAATTGYLAEMQGSWVSTEDIKNTILIEGSSFQSLYDGDPQYDVPIIFVDSCNTRAPDMEGKAFVLHGKEKQTCYLMSAVSEDELSYIDGTRGRTSRFTRKE